MDVSADRGVEIAQGIELICAIANKYGLVIEENTNSDITWFELWANGVDDIVGLCDAVHTTFDGDLGNMTPSNQVFDVASTNGWSVEEDNEGQLVLYTNVYSKESV